jgi:predicted lactoylglutathione lyase
LNILKQLWEDWDKGHFESKAPEGESPFDIETRACGVIYNLLLTRPETHIAFVIHGRLMRAILASLIDKDLSFMKAYSHHNTSINVLEALVFKEGAEVDESVKAEFRKGATAFKDPEVKSMVRDGMKGTSLVHPERVEFKALLLNDCSHLGTALKSSAPFIKGSEPK